MLRAPGGNRASSKSSRVRSYGFCGAIHGANNAISTITNSIARPASASRLSANSRAKRRHGDCARSATTGEAIALMP